MHISTAIAVLWLSSLPAPAGMTAFDLLEDGSIIVPVTIGGAGPYRFMIDTGSSRTVIASRLWRALRAPVVARTIVVTPAGRESAYVVRIDELAVGDRPGVRVDAAVMEADRYAAGQHVDGLIGQDVLSALVYTIDYTSRAVVWHVPNEPLPGVRLPLRIRDNRILVSLAQRDGDPAPLALIPDSGSDRLVFFTHAIEKLRMTSIDVGVLSSLSASRTAHLVEVPRILVGQMRLESSLAALVDSGEPAETLGDGLLPLHLFSRVTFNVAERYLIVTAR